MKYLLFVAVALSFNSKPSFAQEVDNCESKINQLTNAVQLLGTIQGLRSAATSNTDLVEYARLIEKSRDAAKDIEIKALQACGIKNISGSAIY